MLGLYRKSKHHLHVVIGVQFECKPATRNIRQSGLHNAQYTPLTPTWLNRRVASRRRRRWTEFATSSRRLPTDSVDNFGNRLNRLHSGLPMWMLIDIDNFLDNDVVPNCRHFVANLNSSTAQEIVNWVTTADGCVHTADANPPTNTEIRPCVILYYYSVDIQCWPNY